MSIDYKYITISYFGASKSGKTSIYEIENNSSGEVIGIISWYGPWRQYCFYPYYQTVFSKGCMEDIIDFIKELRQGLNSDKRKKWLSPK